MCCHTADNLHAQHFAAQKWCQNGGILAEHLSSLFNPTGVFAKALHWVVHSQWVHCDMRHFKLVFHGILIASLAKWAAKHGKQILCFCQFCKIVVLFRCAIFTFCLMCHHIETPQVLIPVAPGINCLMIVTCWSLGVDTVPGGESRMSFRSRVVVKTSSSKTKKWCVQFLVRERATWTVKAQD